MTKEYHIDPKKLQIADLSDRKLTAFINICDYLTPLEEHSLFTDIIDFTRLYQLKAFAILDQEIRKDRNNDTNDNDS